MVGEGFKWWEMEVSSGGVEENERERGLDTSLPMSRKGNSVECERKRLRASTAGRVQVSSASVEHFVPGAITNYCYRCGGAGVAAAGDGELSRALEAKLGANDGRCCWAGAVGGANFAEGRRKPSAG